MDQLERLLQKMPRPGPSPSLDQRIQALRDERLRREPEWPRRVPFSWLPAVALLAAGLGFLAGFGLGRKPAPSAATAAAASPVRESRVEVHLVALSSPGPFDFCQAEGLFFGRSVTTKP